MIKLLDNMWWNISIEDKIPTSSRTYPVIKIEDKQQELEIYIPIEVFEKVVDVYQSVVKNSMKLTSLTKSFQNNTTRKVE